LFCIINILLNILLYVVLIYIFVIFLFQFYFIDSHLIHHGLVSRPACCAKWHSTPIGSRRF
jgi:hypothetical protein